MLCCVHHVAQFDKPVTVGATLIICPLPILQQWQDEIATHAPSFRVVAYEGSANLLESERFVKAFKTADVVLTTYNTLQRDLSLHRVNPSPLLGVQWWRIMIDEAQMVHNTASAAAGLCNVSTGTCNLSSAVMCSELWRVNGWAVTGTPISNNVYDLHGLLVFLDHGELRLVLAVMLTCRRSLRKPETLQPATERVPGRPHLCFV